MTTGDKTITAAEAEAGFEDFAEKHNIEVTPAMKKEAEMAWEYADTNGDDQLDGAEVKAVWESHGKGYADHCGLQYDW